jgi:acetyl-CoA carboxylase biotin carboxylase subunit
MRKVLVANRGEIAVRIIRACFDEQLTSVLAVSEDDRDSLAAQLADEVVVVGPAAASSSYLSVERMVAAALYAGCDAIHPGYGFLSERPELSRACAEHGLTFVGPPPEVMIRAGDKMSARSVAASVGIPTGGSSSALTTVAEAMAAARQIDAFPVMLKASAGGGGRGMAVISSPEEVAQQFALKHAEAEQAFGDGRLYMESYVAHARHVEVQILADSRGHVVHLGERDCSVQRRHQKLIEEGPAADLPDQLAESIRHNAVRLARELDYVGAGTVEFLVDVDRGTFIFLEVNARVQVEHPVTEAITGVDIVREQLRIAAGRPLSLAQEDLTITGHAIECRINAERARDGFAPSPGLIGTWVVPQATGLRVDTFAYPGARVSPFYDSLVAKVITHAATRAEAIALMRRVLAKLRVEGIDTTADLHLAVLADREFGASPVTTMWLEESFLPTWSPVAAQGR